MYKMNTHRWHLLRTVFLVAGVFVLVSSILGFLIHPYFFYFTAFVGFMQIFFAITGYCPMAILLYKLGLHEK